MAQKEIKTSITILATPEKVWKILSDFEAYDSWNPFLKEMSGDFRVGNKVSINAGGMTFKPTILVFKENKELRWIGRLLFKGLFDGEHVFQIIDNNDGTITFKHEEYFSGLLVGMFAKKLDNETRKGFEDMNLKLKDLAENG
jgi:hypothetical protein